MSLAFTINDEIDVDAAPDDVWKAITVSPRIDSWFTGHTEIEPRSGGRVRTTVRGVVLEFTVIVWEPPRRLTCRSNEDGPCIELDWHIEAREGGGSTVHLTHCGHLAIPNAQAVYEALRNTDPMYVRKLARYLEYFNGQIATRNISVPGPVVDRARFWSTLERSLGLGHRVTEWDPVRTTIDGVAQIEGVVDYVTPEFLGVRTSIGLFRFIHASDGMVLVEHHDFSPAQNDQLTATAWQAWLTKHF